MLHYANIIGEVKANDNLGEERLVIRSSEGKEDYVRWSRIL